MLLATEDTDDEVVVERIEPIRPVTDLLEGWWGDGPLVTLLAGSIDVIAQVLLIFLVATIALSVIKRLIRRAVHSAAHPSADVTRGARRRIALLEETEPRHSTRRVQRAEALGALAVSIARVVVWALASLTVLGTAFGISLAPLIAGAGIIGVAVGFGAQGLVRDLITGIFMLAEDQYGVGDIVDVGPATGVVEGVTLRTTRIRDVTGTLWHVPNGEITRVGNMSQEWARALLDIGVGYGTDIEAASELILGVATEMAGEEAFEAVFLDTPEIWGIENLGDDSIDIRLVVKTEPGQQWAIARELRRRIKHAFDAAEVEIPFPQRTVWLRTEQPVALGGPDRTWQAGGSGQAAGAVDDGLAAAHRGEPVTAPGDLDEVVGEVTAPGEDDPPR